MADNFDGYKDIPEEDRKKAKVFFDRGNTVAGTGNYEYAIEMYLQGLAIDPDAFEAHQTLREISLKRKASGGKDLGMFEKIKLKKPTKDDKQNMLNSEKLMSYDPGNTDHMVSVMQNAHRAGFYDTAMWVGPILQKANADSPKPEFNKFIILKDIYKALNQWKLATDACHYAAMLHPDDMDLQTELKNLGAQDTMKAGNYSSAGSFRDSVRDMAKQGRLMQEDKDIRSVDALKSQIADAEKDWQADPGESGKFMKLIDLLIKTETPEYENRAIELLEEQFDRTRQFRFRFRVGEIQLAQLSRMERSLRANLAANPQDAEARQQYMSFLKEKTQKEYEEFKLWAENYPTENRYKFNMAVKLFELRRYEDAIPVFQTVRTDPKFKYDAQTYLGRSFLEAGFNDEAVETLQVAVNEYVNRGDSRSKEMTYWLGRALEAHGQSQPALKAFSQVFQWDANYRDVQGRIKKLRSGQTA